MLQGLLAQLYPLLQREQRGLLLAVGNRNHHFAEQARCPLRQIDVAVGDRVEAARVDNRMCSHGNARYQEISCGW